MSKAPPKAAPAEAPAAKSKKLLIVIIVLLVVLLLAAAAGFLLLSKKRGAKNDGGEQVPQEEVHVAAPKAPPIVVKLDQFTVKLQADEGRAEQYMQTLVELEVIDAATGEKLKLFMSKIRARVLLLMMGKKPSDIATPAGVELMMAQIRNEINTILDGRARQLDEMKAAPGDLVQAVYLTQFIIQ